MAQITIGVPVFNEAALLGATLENLRTQSFDDFQVLIFDNASTDDTPDVAARFASLDPRFQHVRQPFNKGALNNFDESLRAANSPFFMWRACDDRCDENYLEVLHRELLAHPDRDVAVGNVVSSDFDGGNSRRFESPKFSQTGSLRTIQAVLGGRPSWIYGLYRREPLTTRMKLVMQDYRDGWGFDHLILLSFLLASKIIGTADTTFYQIKKRIRGPRKVRRSPPAIEEIDRMIVVRQRFFAVGRRMISEEVRSKPERAFYNAVLWYFIGKRVYKFRRIAWRLWTK
jgi:glycosyltransferase involved in cell wall biosynthesis